MPQSAQEFAEITALIKGILNGYPGNSAILREYLQNSDDAKATSQIFILDERSYPTDSLVDPALKETQGPALIAVNDGILRDVDWTALRKINSSSKKSDESQTGKNGLGFRASYHLTENPHVLSGRTLMILDPHQAFKVHKGGISIDFIDEGHEYQDQLAPFSFLFEPSKGVFNGTVFRLPLRTEEQAARSQIKDTATSIDDIRAVLRSFGSDELEEAILFLKHITTITIRHIDASGQETTTMSISIDALPSPCPPSHTRTVIITASDRTTTARTWQFNHHAEDKATAEYVMTDRLGYDIGDGLTKEKFVPTVDVAIPLDGSHIRGRLFTLLPFPQLTNFPLHLNAVFALTTDRQSLKNILEVGQKKSRERRLVMWNRVIFNTWTPIVWADMLTALPSHVLGPKPWSLWPPEERGEDCYWAGLTRELFKVVISRNLSIFPTRPSQVSTQLVAINGSDVVLASPNPGVCLDTLSSLGVHVVQPPRHIFDILSSETFQLSLSILSPRSLHSILCRIPKNVVERCERKKLQAIMDYLVFSDSPPNLLYITGLPWFNCTNGHPAVLGLASQATSQYFIPSSAEEAQLFASHSHMLTWESCSEKLRMHLSLPSASQILNVAVMNARDVFSFLSNMFKFPGSNMDEVSGDVEWMIKFWSWVVRWSKQKLFFQGIGAVSDLYLLPTAKETLRKLSSGILSFVKTDSSVIHAWDTLGVSPLHPNIHMKVASSLQAASYVHIPCSSTYIIFLIRNCNSAPPGISLEARLAAFKTIRRSLYDGWPRDMTIHLSSQEKEKFASFPIFKVHTEPGAGSSLGAAFGYRIYVQIADHFPLPCLQISEIYVDWSDFITQRFVSILDSGSAQVKKEFDLIQLAVDNWAIQPAEVQDLFIDQAFQCWRRLPAQLRSDLTRLPFVTVNDTPTRKPPKDLIHPTSILKDLYTGEVGRMPSGRFAENDYLATLQSLGFLRVSLDAFIIEDRLQYLSRPPLDNSNLRQKAIIFVEVLDRHWKGAFSSLIAKNRHLQWLPTKGSTDLVSPAQCRDSRRETHSHPYYYDLILNVLEGGISSSSLRSGLGWSDIVSLNVLVNQLRKTLELPARFERNERLVELLTYFDLLLRDHHLSNDAIELLRNITCDQSWVPISSHSSRHTVHVKHALLSDGRLRLPFRTVDNRLKENLFLRELGCTPRPSLDVLMEEFSQIQLASQSGLESALAILDEIATHHPICDSNREHIRIPGEDFHPYPLDAVYFRDMKFTSLSAAVSGMMSAHKMISKGLAEALGIQMLSSLTLGDDDEDEDEEQMSEDLVGRIRGFLRDYDPQYALNEFLANADDAGAHQFQIYLDRRTWRGADHVISPKFQSVLASTSLLLFNDSTMSDQDFKGLRRIGQGGKLALSDTHGRHGLGALSLYYFTDVVTVISGEFVMILDPSGEYLPPLRKCKRTALKRTITEIMSKYPEQLKSFEVFGISPAHPTYKGTIFALPLNSTISEKACDYSLTRHLILDNYRKLAQHAFFFTRLERIVAMELLPEKVVLWDTSARKSTVNPLGENFTWCNFYIKLDSTAEEEDTWLITTSEVLDIPTEHEQTAIGLKLTGHSKMKVQLAINREKLKAKSLETYPFSTMVLPKPTSLPFHVNARFAISSNRQGLVLNSADSRSQKDAKTSFNAWILGTAVPPLYLASLEHLIHSGNLQNHSFSDARWWLLKCPDDISKIVRDGFFKALTQVEHRIFKSVDDQWISFRDSVFSKEEPREVRNVLNAIQAPKFVHVHRHTDISSIPTARIVDTSFVKETLQHQTSLLTLRQLLSNGIVRNEDVFALLHYIRAEPPLAGLPLLILSSGNLIKIPNKFQTEVYLSDDSKSHYSLFPTSNFVQIGYSAEMLDCFKNDIDVNVVALTEERVLSLIGRELVQLTVEDKIKWVHKFWRMYSTLPGPPSPESLESSGFYLIEGSSGVVSLRDCFPDKVVYDSVLSLSSPGIIPILAQMNIEVVKSTENPILHQFISKRFPEQLENILKCIVNRGRAAWEALSTQQHIDLATWIRGQLPGKVSSTSWRQAPPVAKGDLLSLPIWEAQLTTQLFPASALQVLPSHFFIRHIVPYLRPSTAIATSSTTLPTFKSFCMGIRYSNFTYMTCQQILDAIILPPQVTQSTQVRDMKAFIQAMLGFSTSDLRSITGGFMVPDRDGVLRPIRALYDDTVDLFAQTLTRTGTPSFVQPQFRDMVPRLRELGLVHEITVENFRTCARAIEEASSGDTSVQSLREMCTTAFRVYQSQLPSLIMLNARSWESLESIAFVLRKDQRRQGASYDVDRYFDQPLPLIMPPSRFVRPNLESIVWTQRALFFSEPSDQLLTLNTKLGIPEVGEVVAHLIMLTTRIARDHARDAVLLSDIKATYKWLNEHHAEARIHLLAAENEKIFLNVTSAEVESWDGKWATAKELVINLHYDTKSIKYVRDFLQSYENLLLAAGCGTLKTLKRELAPSVAGSEVDLLRRMRMRFNDMRKRGKLTDIVLVPEIDDGAVDKAELRAHGAFLAAAIPHLEILQDWPKAVATGEIILKAGTAFGAKCILDFVYHGELELSKPTIDVDILAILLRDLLELLPIVDEWDMKDLKEKLQWEIIHKHDMIQRLPHGFDTMFEAAEKYHAEMLKDALAEFKNQNGKLLQDLKEDHPED